MGLVLEGSVMGAGIGCGMACCCASVQQCIVVGCHAMDERKVLSMALTVAAEGAALGAVGAIVTREREKKGHSD